MLVGVFVVYYSKALVGIFYNAVVYTRNTFRPSPPPPPHRFAISHRHRERTGETTTTTTTTATQRRRRRCERLLFGSVERTSESDREGDETTRGGSWH